MHASGVNPVDTYIRSGTYVRQPNLPYTPGLDAAGVIERVGAEVTKYKVLYQQKTLVRKQLIYLKLKLFSPKNRVDP